MAAYRALVKNYLDQKGVKYNETEKFVSVKYNADNVNGGITVFVTFGDNDGKAEFVCFSIGKFDPEQFAKGLVACNDCNNKYRWVKFYINDENEIAVRADAILDEETCGAECHEIIQRMVTIIDQAYPVFMKARWG